MMYKLIAAFLIIFFLAAASCGASLLDYQKRVFRAAEQIERIKTDSQYSEEGASYVKRLLPKSERVDANGQPMMVDNTWLHILLDSYLSEHNPQRKRAELDEAAGRLIALDQHLRSLIDHTARNNASAERERLRQILARPEFQTQDKSPMAAFIKKLKQRIANALRDLWDQIFGKLQPASPQAVWLIKALILVVLAAAVILAVRTLMKVKRTQRLRKKRTILGEQIQSDTKPRDLAESAMAAARAGDFRTAIRRLYIALLYELAERNLIELEINATNRDYLNRVSQLAPLAAPMRYLTEKFDYFWYGKFPSTEDDFRDYFLHYLKAAELARGLSSA
jgi:hypothetical protein